VARSPVLVISSRNRVTFSRVAAALVLGLVVGALPCFIPIVAHLYRVILSNPLEATPAGVVVIHVAAVINASVLFRLVAGGHLVAAVLAANPMANSSCSLVKYCPCPSTGFSISQTKTAASNRNPRSHHPLSKYRITWIKVRTSSW
jgi:hypothetical protein